MPNQITQPLQSLEYILSQLRTAYERSKEIEERHPNLRKVIQTAQPPNTAESKLNSELYEAFQACYKDYQNLQSLLPPRRDGGSTYELGPPRPYGV